MGRVAILPLESSNRVYGAQAAELLVAELCALQPHFPSEIDAVAIERFGGLDYVVVTIAGQGDVTSAGDVFLLTNLSGTRAVFALHRDPKCADAAPLFAPIDHLPLAFFDSDLVTIQRYTGKTNEQFTHLMLNLGVAASTAAAQRIVESKPVRVFDPVAGRGTTLNRALLAGYDAAGVELSASDVDQYRGFIVNYLRSHRIKHKLDREQIRKGPLAGASRFTVTIGKARGPVEPARQQRVEMVHGDTTQADEMFPARSFDVLVADLPYGVQHRSTTGAAAVSGRRTPHELLADSLPAWRTVLRGGASVTLSWNVRTLPRADVEALLREHGFDVINQPRSFEHVVDRSITRDLVVARK